MSKNLENTYKEYIRTETPDLWDRIEKSLPERETVWEEKQEAGDKRAEKSKSGQENNEVRARKRTAKFYARIGGSLAAAILVLAVAAPVLKNQLFNGGQLKSNSESSFTMNAADEACEEAVQTAGSTGSMAEVQDAVDGMEVFEEAQEVFDEAVNDASKQESGAEVNAEEAEDSPKEAVSENGLVSLELTISRIEENEAGEAVYFAESETGESYSFVLAEDAFLEEEILQEGGILQGNRYAVELEKGEEGYRAAAVRKK